MGSAWTVKIAGPLPLPAEELRAGIQERFEFVNQALSTYRVDSALSRFNLDDSGEWVELDPELRQVLLEELRRGVRPVEPGLHGKRELGPLRDSRLLEQCLRLIEIGRVLEGRRIVSLNLWRHGTARLAAETGVHSLQHFRPRPGKIHCLPRLGRLQWTRDCHCPVLVARHELT